jgi:pimeloyl-ACP methyl ester carboxylesterase
LPFVLVCLLACFRPHPHPHGPGHDDSATDDTGTPPEPEVVWTECGEGTECADIATPLDHADPDGSRFDLHVRRLPTAEPASRALWLAVGGPGDPGTVVTPDLAFFQKVFPALEIYTFDHRGTGSSAALHCPDQEAEESEGGKSITDGEWPACIASLDESRLAVMTVSQAADDLAWALERVDGPPAVVWGISYGSYLVDRFVARHPDRLDAVILDGLVPPDWTFAEFDAAMDTTGREYLALCDADPDCAKRLGGDAIAFAEATIASLATAPCAGIDDALARAALGTLLLQGDDREAIPAVLVRLDRCDAADEKALAHLAGALPTEVNQNEVLLANIGTSELWPDDGPTAEEAAAALEGTVIATGVSAWMAALAEQWPRYETSETTEERPAIPAILLHGGLDPTVRIDRTAAMRAAYPEGQSVLPPGAGHVTLNFSDCAAGAYVQFLDDPQLALVADCTDEPFSEQFDLPAAQAQRLFGESDGWGGSG